MSLAAEQTTIPVTALKGIGPKTGAALAKLGIHTTADLIRHYPCRFACYPALQTLNTAEEDTSIAVQATLQTTLTVIRRGRLVMTQGKLADVSGEIAVRWYNMPYLKKSLSPGRCLVFFGKVQKKGGLLFLEQPKIFWPGEYETLRAHPAPVYPLSAGITNRVLIRAIQESLSRMPFQPDWLPKELCSAHQLMDEDTAIREIHAPQSIPRLAAAKRRIIFNEFYEFLLGVRKMKERASLARSAFPMDCSDILSDARHFLPFSLTAFQEKVCLEITGDLASGTVMNRLLQGDVGSGKTVVALIALYAAFRNGYQSAIMVPTEVLARQHQKTMEQLLRHAEQKPRILLLTGSLKDSEKKEVQKQIESHAADIVIGTHALIQEPVKFHRLALVVTDEQHRFGVQQRGMFAEKGLHPHMLVMSATPIPRTLAVILYGDLDISTIEARPSGRLPVKNAVITKQERPNALLHIKKELEKGHQAYIICPLVEKSEFLDAENVLDYSEALRESFRGIASVGCLHGRMKEEEKQRVMEDFAAQKIDILVSTTVIEVGIDVPNATVMMIEDAERYGLASLHQLRGRVGRGSGQSYCIFVQGKQSERGKKRLEILAHSNDGFAIAAADLKMRGPGELFGAEQSGELTFGLGDIYNDYPVLQTAKAVLEEYEPGENRKTLRQDVIL